MVNTATTPLALPGKQLNTAGWLWPFPTVHITNGTLMTIRGQGWWEVGASETIFLERESSQFCLDTSSPRHSVPLEAGKLPLVENNLFSGEIVTNGSQNPSPCDCPMQT